METYRVGHTGPWQAIAGALALCATAPAIAGSSVTPLEVDLVSGKATGQVNFWNGGNEPIIVQASAATWRQVDGQDLREETHDLAISPAIIEIPPRTGQVFRLRLRGPMPNAETAYRLFLEDVTPPKQTGGVAYRVRHDLPVFVMPGPGKAALSINRCSGSPAGCIQIDNRGNQHAKVTAIRLSGTGWQRDVPATGTVLAGSSRRWTASLPQKAAGPVRVSVTTSEGPLTAEWPATGD